MKRAMALKAIKKVDTNNGKIIFDKIVKEDATLCLLACTVTSVAGHTRFYEHARRIPFILTFYP